MSRIARLVAKLIAWAGIAYLANLLAQRAYEFIQAFAGDVDSYEDLRD